MLGGNSDATLADFTADDRRAITDAEVIHFTQMDFASSDEEEKASYHIAKMLVGPFYGPRSST